MDQLLSHGSPLKKPQLLILNVMTLSFLLLFSQMFISEILMVKAKHGLFSPTLGLSLPLQLYAVPELAISSTLASPLASYDFCSTTFACFSFLTREETLVT